MGGKATTLSEKFNRRGLWWLPSYPNRKIPGQVSFDPDGELQLELDGSLREKMPIGSGDHFYAPLVFGATTDGKLCTLLDVSENFRQTHSPGMTTSKSSFSQLIIGQSHIDPLTTKYESALLEFSDFCGWMHRDPFTYEASRTEVYKQTVSHTMPSEVKILVSALTAEVSFTPSMNTNMEYQQRALKHFDSVQIKPIEPQDGEWYKRVVYKMRVLLSLLVGRPVVATAFKLCTGMQQISEHNEGCYPLYVDLCVKQAGKAKGKDLLPPEIPFTYPRIAASMPAILNTWFSKTEQLSTLYSLFFGTTINRSIPREFQFLALIQALESYHRESGGDKYLSKEGYEEIRTALTNAIPKSTPADLRDALKSRIKYGNEYSLRKRLELTLNKVPEALRNIFVQGNEQFIFQVVATRNYLTHRDESLKDNVLDDKGIFDAAVSLQLLIQYILLTELGIDEKTVARVMQEHHAYKNRPQIILYNQRAKSNSHSKQTSTPNP